MSMPVSRAEQSPILEAAFTDDAEEAALQHRPNFSRVVRIAAVTTLGCVLVAGVDSMVSTIQGNGRRWTTQGLLASFSSLSGTLVLDQLSEPHSTDCDWIPRDLCLRADPEKCRCRALWRSGAYESLGFGPCGKHGERDPCLLASYRGPCGPNYVRRLGGYSPCTLAGAFSEIGDSGDSETAEKSSSHDEGEIPKSGKVPAWKNRIGSFLVIGDWGWDSGSHGNVRTTSCQTKIADAMLQKMRELKDVKFIINVGDSFYPSGVKGKWDPQWQEKWRDRFPEELRSVPWYSTYGNHDYHIDPAACSDDPADGAQINWNISDRDYFYMPGYNWIKEHPELGLEVISLDLNQIMDAWNHQTPLIPKDCMYTPCKQKCEKLLTARTKEAVQLFHERANISTARNMVVFSHYPTDYLWGAFDPWKLIDELRVDVAADGSPRHVTYFGGHRHNVDQTSTEPILPSTNWLVGGGGGWSCDGKSQGFVVGEIDERFNLITYPQLVDWNVCCGDEQYIYINQTTEAL